MNVRDVRQTLVRHRFLGKFGWRYLRAGNGSARPEFQSYGDVIKLKAETAVAVAHDLQAGELAWFELVRDVKELAQYPSTLGDKLRYLESLAVALRKHPLKNRSLSAMLAEASTQGQRARQLERRNHNEAAQLSKQAIGRVADLLSDRKGLVLLVNGYKQPKSRLAERGPHRFTPAQIDKAVKTWANYPGFTADSCGECGATANVLGGGPGWFCECGHYNLQCWHCFCIPHESPDYGPPRADIVLGNHASCDKDCRYCHGKIRLPASA